MVKKAGIPVNWISYAVACCLAGNYEMAIEVGNSFKKIQQDAKDKDKIKKYEMSELNMLLAKCYEENG